MARNLMVCAHSSKALTVLNESAGPNKDIYLEGIFAELDVKNRNNRIYTREEYLKHLDYIRADIRDGQSLLGELDHPEDRFEVKLKEASHQIVDIWYDRQSNCVMGKIRLLHTPNGLLAQSILEQGIPLHISSRAAGTVNPDNTVKIQQIYTYDLVCKPGFAKAVLHTVNESASATSYTDDAKSFMIESEATDNRNIADSFGMSSDVVLISEMASTADFRQEALAIQQLNFDNDMINENKDMELNPEDSNVCPNCGGTGNEPYSGKPCENCNGNGKPGMNEDEDIEDDNTEESSSDEENKDDAKEDKGVEIISVKAITDADDESNDDEVEIKDVESVSDDEESKEDDDADDDNSESEDDEKNEEDETSESDADEAKKCDDEKDMLLDCDDIKKRKSSFEDKFADLVDAIKRKNDDKKKNESMTVSKYPMSALLNEGMFADFMSMNDTQKSNVMTYITESNINPSNMNEAVWESAKTYVPEQENWLRYAPANYKTLFESADEMTKSSIRNTAQYLLFENQHDINAFWRNTGLKEINEKNLLNEQFMNNMPRIENVNENEGLGYSKEYINMIAEMASAYNN